jgi:putative tryptophan/tyrosine transport system substrate-binding protein
MKRREFITLLGSATVAWPLAARAEQQTMPVVGFLNPYPETDPDLNEWLLAFKLRLRERGWTDGRNLRMDIRSVGHDDEPARVAAAELIAHSRRPQSSRLLRLRTALSSMQPATSRS